jgi:penicillin-binding protein 1A
MKVSMRSCARGTWRTVVSVVISVATLSVVGAASAWHELPRTVPTAVAPLAANSQLYDAHGRLLGDVEGSENRYPRALVQMGSWTADATVAIEDRRFWTHDGFDVRGIARSVMHNARSDSREGASTITQQLVRSEQPQIYYMAPLQRKFYELQASRAMEAALRKGRSRSQAKREILTRYLNAVYYGHRAYGIEAASRTFFARPASQLDLAQSALLAGLVQSPTRYDPFTASGRPLALARQKQVLASMQSLGWIDKTQQAYAAREALHFASAATIRRLPYVQDQVRAQLESWYGQGALADGGLRVWTTIQPRAQRQAEQTLRAHLDQQGDPEGALVSIDNASGQIVAMASTATYTHSQYNLATQAKRQPGSTAKVWGLATLIRLGIDPEKLRYSSMPIEVRRGDGAIWKPQTYDGSYAGREKLHEATLASDNSVFAQLSLDLGSEEIARTAEEWGVGRRLASIDSIILGSQEVSVLEQTNFYSTIARGGVRRDPVLIRRIEHSTYGSVAVPAGSAHRVAPTARVQTLQRWLADNVRSGTGVRAQLAGRPAAGKTGTTDDFKDAWFCGFTAQLTTCVWVGYVHPTPMLNVHGIRVAGGTIPAEIWHDYNESYHATLPVRDVVSALSDPAPLPLWPDASFRAGGWLNDPRLEIIKPFYKPLNASSVTTMTP